MQFVLIPQTIEDVYWMWYKLYLNEHILFQCLVSYFNIEYNSLVVINVTVDTNIYRITLTRFTDPKWTTYICEWSRISGFIKGKNQRHLRTVISYYTGYDKFSCFIHGFLRRQSDEVIRYSIVSEPSELYPRPPNMLRTRACVINRFPFGYTDGKRCKNIRRFRVSYNTIRS